jgi:hypothetical protein
MLEVLVVNAASAITLLMAIEAMYPGKRLTTPLILKPVQKRL